MTLNPDPVSMNNISDEFYDYICNISLDPISLRRIFLILQRNLFADPENHFGESNRDYLNFKYSDNPEERKISIDCEYTDDSSDAKINPNRITVGFQQFQLKSPVLDKYNDVNEDGSVQTYTDAVTTTLVVKHYAKSADDALGMAYISTNFYLGIRKLLQDKLGFLKFEVVGLSEVKLKNPDADKLYEVDVAVNIVFNFTQDVSEESHRLSKVSVVFKI